jgi:hypothetical protein
VRENYYGGRYWSVETQAERIWLHSDGYKIVDGDLVFFREAKDGRPEQTAFVFHRGFWKYFYAASLFDGGCEAIQHWDPPESPTRLEFKGRQKDKISPTIRHAVFKRDGHKCVLCGKTSKDGVGLVIDHVVPLAKGGTNSERNLQTLCDPCNAGKAGK